MSELITRTRRLIGDNGSSQQFSDDEIQNMLDQHKVHIRYTPLQEVQDISTSGSVSYKEFWAINARGGHVRNWEGTAGDNLFFLDGGWGTITPSTFNYIEGKFRFSTAPTRPVYVSGFYYDVEGAAADLCEEWAAAVKLCVTFSDGSDKIDLNAQYTHLIGLAEKLRRRQTTISVAMTRSDVNRSGFSGDDPRRYNSRLPRG